MRNINILVLVLMILTASTGQALSNVNVQPAKVEVNLDGTFVVYVNVTPGVQIAGMQTNIRYNPALIRIDSIQEGNLFTWNNRSTFFNPGQINNSAGTVINIFNVILGAHSTNVMGTFITIHATPLNRGSSTIELYNVKIAKPNGTAESVSWTNAAVVITNPSYDVNMDGMTDILDLTIVASHFGESTVGRWDANGIPPVDIYDLVCITQYLTIATPEITHET